MKTYEQNKEKARAAVRLWNLNNPGKMAEYQRRWYLKNKEKACANAKLWRLNNPEKTRAANRRRVSVHSGLTPEEIAKKLQSQDGKCAICGTRNPKKWNGDHNHVTGKFRGVLCNTCNSGIGMLKDDPKLTRAATIYLEKGEQ